MGGHLDSLPRLGGRDGAEAPALCPHGVCPVLQDLFRCAREGVGGEVELGAWVETPEKSVTHCAADEVQACSVCLEQTRELRCHADHWLEPCGDHGRRA